jgi:hypothetical protein
VYPTIPPTGDAEPEDKEEVLVVHTLAIYYNIFIYMFIYLYIYLFIHCQVLNTDERANIHRALSRRTAFTVDTLRRLVRSVLYLIHITLLSSLFSLVSFIHLHMNVLFLFFYVIHSF